jgi:serine/threonine protein kinase
MNRYSILETVGDGSFGTVFKGKCLRTGDIVAVKHIKKKFSSWQECLSLREVASLTKLRHENIIRLRELIYVKEDGGLNFVFEFADGNLFSLLQGRKALLSSLPSASLPSFLRPPAYTGSVLASGFREDEVRVIGGEILRGLSSMHRHGFFHRDLKPENILLTTIQPSSSGPKKTTLGAQELASIQVTPNTILPATSSTANTSTSSTVNSAASASTSSSASLPLPGAPSAVDDLIGSPSGGGGGSTFFGSSASDSKQQQQQQLIFKLCDFGQARETRSRPPYTNYCGTRWYRAPEIILGLRSYNSPIDQWACGCILAECVLGKPLFPGTSSLNQIYTVASVLGPVTPALWQEGYRAAASMGVRFSDVSAGAGGVAGASAAGLLPSPNAAMGAAAGDHLFSSQALAGSGFPSGEDGNGGVAAVPPGLYHLLCTVGGASLELCEAVAALLRWDPSARLNAGDALTTLPFFRPFVKEVEERDKRLQQQQQQAHAQAAQAAVSGGNSGGPRSLSARSTGSTGGGVGRWTEEDLLAGAAGGNNGGGVLTSSSSRLSFAVGSSNAGGGARISGAGAVGVGAAGGGKEQEGSAEEEDLEAVLQGLEDGFASKAAASKATHNNSTVKPASSTSARLAEGQEQDGASSSSFAAAAEGKEAATGDIDIERELADLEALSSKKAPPPQPQPTQQIQAQGQGQAGTQSHVAVAAARKQVREGVSAIEDEVEALLSSAAAATEAAANGSNGAIGSGSSRKGPASEGKEGAERGAAHSDSETADVKAFDVSISTPVQPSPRPSAAASASPAAPIPSFPLFVKSGAAAMSTPSAAVPQLSLQQQQHSSSIGTPQAGLGASSAASSDSGSSSSSSAAYSSSSNSNNSVATPTGTARSTMPRSSAAVTTSPSPRDTTTAMTGTGRSSAAPASSTNETARTGRTEAAEANTAASNTTAAPSATAAATTAAPTSARVPSSSNNTKPPKAVKKSGGGLSSLFSCVSRSSTVASVDSDSTTPPGPVPGNKAKGAASSSSTVDDLLKETAEAL